MLLDRRTRTTLILGAGWSAAAGLPLARDLVAGPIVVPSEAARRRCQVVLDTYAEWSRTEVAPRSETFLALVRDGQIGGAGLRQYSLFAESALPLLPWSWAVEAVVSRLVCPLVVPPEHSWYRQAVRVDPRYEKRLRYAGNLSVGPDAPTLTAFLRALLETCDLAGVVTTNYDTLTERLLRHRPVHGEPEPGFIYGGLPRPQIARGHLGWDRSNPDIETPGELELRGNLPLYKLHGSINWEIHNRIEIRRDHRLAFSSGGSGAAIVPPLPEKEAPPWLEAVWTDARSTLMTSEEWIVVGYSLPPYDHALESLFQDAAAGCLRRVIVHDPLSRTLVARWRDVTGVEITPAAAVAPSPWDAQLPDFYDREQRFRLWRSFAEFRSR